MPEGNELSDLDARLAVADALLAEDDAWAVMRPVRDGAGAVVDLVYVYANEAAHTVVGLGRLAGRRLLELVPEVREGLWPVYLRVLEGGGPERVLFPNVVREHGGPWQPGWTAIDIHASGDLLVTRSRDASTEHTDAVAAARTEARLQALLANAGELITVYSPDGMVPLYQSPSLERVLGRAASDTGITANVHPDDRAAVERSVAQVIHGGHGACDELEVRLRHGDGRWLWFHVRGANYVDDPDVGGIVINAWDVTVQRELADQLRQQALQDPLTGLPNRRLIDSELQRALSRAQRAGGCVGLVMCDVDYFKSVNDALGHPVGDDLLVQVAERLRAVVRPADTVGRLGGDEFVVVAEDLHERRELTTLTQRLQRAVRGVYRVGGQDLPVTVTLGASCSTPEATATALLTEADTALYEAKRAGRDRSQVFDKRAHRRSRDRAVRQAGLRTAVEQDQLVLHYQPKVELGTGQAVSAEALVRWQHPTDGLLHPGSFLPLAEESLLVVDLGEWVLAEAMREAVAWRLPDPGAVDRSAPGIDINISGRHLTHPRFLDHLDRALGDSAIDPSRVELEITETVLLQDLEMTGRILAGVRERGVRIALDDFGTGYSSLTWLQRLPVDTVKLDRSFIADLLSTEGGFGPDILGSVTSLAQALGKKVIAEGVETREQHDYLVGLGCDQAQGYFYGRPTGQSPFPRTTTSSAASDPSGPALPR